MEKLSGILPSNARIKAVDLKESHPVRPGVPNFGRPEGSTVKDRISLSSIAREMAQQEIQGIKNEKFNARKVEIANQAVDSFFGNRLKEFEDEAKNDNRVRSPELEFNLVPETQVEPKVQKEAPLTPAPESPE